MLSRTPTARFYIGITICMIYVVWIFFTILGGNTQEFFFAREVGFWRMILAFIPLIVGVIMIAPFFFDEEKSSRE